MESDVAKVGIEIQKVLYNKIEKRVKTLNAGFKNVEEYVAFVLEEVLIEEEERVDTYQGEDEEIKSRLKSLGYI